MERKWPVTAIQVESGMAMDVGTRLCEGGGAGEEEDQLISVDWAFEVQSGVRRAGISGALLLMGINMVVITLVATVMMLGDNMSKN